MSSYYQLERANRKRDVKYRTAESTSLEKDVADAMTAQSLDTGANKPAGHTNRVVETRCA